MNNDESPAEEQRTETFRKASLTHGDSTSQSEIPYLFQASVIAFSLSFFGWLPLVSEAFCPKQQHMSTVDSAIKRQALIRSIEIKFKVWQVPSKAALDLAQTSGPGGPLLEAHALDWPPAHHVPPGVQGCGVRYGIYCVQGSKVWIWGSGPKVLGRAQALDQHSLDLILRI